MTCVCGSKLKILEEGGSAAREGTPENTEGGSQDSTYCVNFHVVGLPSASTMIPRSKRRDLLRD